MSEMTKKEALRIVLSYAEEHVNNCVKEETVLDAEAWKEAHEIVKKVVARAV